MSLIYLYLSGLLSLNKLMRLFFNLLFHLLLALKNEETLRKFKDLMKKRPLTTHPGQSLCDALSEPVLSVFYVSECQ